MYSFGISGQLGRGAAIEPLSQPGLTCQIFSAGGSFAFRGWHQMDSVQRLRSSAGRSLQRMVATLPNPVWSLIFPLAQGLQNAK